LKDRIKRCTVRIDSSCHFQFQFQITFFLQLTSRVDNKTHTTALIRSLDKARKATKANQSTMTNRLKIKHSLLAMALACAVTTNTLLVSAERLDPRHVSCREICDRYFRKELTKDDCYPALKVQPAPKMYKSCIAGRRHGFEASCMPTCMSTTTVDDAGSYDSHTACLKEQSGLKAAVDWCRNGYASAVAEVQRTIPSRMQIPGAMNNNIVEMNIVVDGPSARAPSSKSGGASRQLEVDPTPSTNEQAADELLHSATDANGAASVDIDAVENNERSKHVFGRDSKKSEGTAGKTKKTGGKNFSQIRGAHPASDSNVVANSKTDAEDAVNHAPAEVQKKRSPPMDLFLDPPPSSNTIVSNPMHRDEEASSTISSSTTDIDIEAEASIEQHKNNEEEQTEPLTLADQ
jgi:hypothetical protein